jgi:excisionase family DNA binding protein
MEAVETNGPETTEVPEYMSAREAAKVKGCQGKSILKAIERKDLRARRVGHQWVIHRDDLEAWVKVGHRKQNKRGRPRVVRPLVIKTEKA